MINKLVFANLRYRWVRTFLCALVVGVQVMSILTLIGLSRGLLQDSASRAQGAGADIWLKPGQALSLSTGQVNEKFVPLVAKQPHVRDAVPVLISPVGGTDILTTLSGVDIPAFTHMSGGFRLLKGQLPSQIDDVMVDEYYATQHHVTVGQTISILKHRWLVCGIIQSGTLGRLVTDIRRLQDLTGNPSRISQILVKLDNPANTQASVAQLNQVLEGNLTAISAREFISQFSIDRIPALRGFIAVITGLAVSVGFLVVFLSMYTAVVERTREIGILKALGAKPITIVNMLVREALFLAIVGCLIGIVLAYIAKGVITGLAPASFPVVSAPDWWINSALIAIVGALLGAIYPGLKAARQDAIEALAYE